MLRQSALMMPGCDLGKIMVEQILKRHRRTAEEAAIDEELKKEREEKFLTSTKREYLPMIIKFFIAKPKEDIFGEKPSAKWWQFWKG